MAWDIGSAPRVRVGTWAKLAEVGARGPVPSAAFGGGVPTLAPDIRGDGWRDAVGRPGRCSNASARDAAGGTRSTRRRFFTDVYIGRPGFAGAGGSLAGGSRLASHGRETGTADRRRKRFAGPVHASGFVRTRGWRS